MSHEGKMRRGKKWEALIKVKPDYKVPPNYAKDVEYYIEHSKPVEKEVKIRTEYTTNSSKGGFKCQHTLQ